MCEGGKEREGLWRKWGISVCFDHLVSLLGKKDSSLSRTWPLSSTLSSIGPRITFLTSKRYHTRPTYLSPLCHLTLFRRFDIFLWWKIISFSHCHLDDWTITVIIIFIISLSRYGVYFFISSRLSLTLAPFFFFQKLCVCVFVVILFSLSMQKKPQTMVGVQGVW